MSKSKLNAAIQAIDWIKPKIDSDSLKTGIIIEILSDKN